MSQKNPIKFLDSYSRDDLDIFFGRAKETSDLYDKITKSKLVLLYGMSGTGKTSLINCGLENRYEADQRNFIYVRRGNDILVSFKQAITLKASTLIHPDADLAEALESLYYDSLIPITVVFDQFEELFISGNDNEKQLFKETIAAILQSDLKVKLIISLREEYLAHMDEFEKEIPTIYDHRYRLEKMRRLTLIEVINKIAAKLDCEFEELENEDIPGIIIGNISDKKGNVDLPYLQVYLDKLTKLMPTTDNEKKFTKNLVDKAGKLEDVLGDFLEEQINRIASKGGNEKAINNLLKQFITADGTKKRLALSDIKPYWSGSSDKLNEVLNKLEKSQIIKLENAIYELSHDSLAKKIAEKRTPEELQWIKLKYSLRNASQTGTLLNRKQLRNAKPFKQHSDLSADEKKLMNKSRIKVRFMNLGLCVLIIGVLGISLYIINGWRMDKYDKLIENAGNKMAKADYSFAKDLFKEASNIIHLKLSNSNGIIHLGNTKAEDSIKRCEVLMGKKAKYDQIKKMGDSLFELGLSYYSSAFRQYYSAKSLGYKPKDMDNLIANRVEDATRKYIELANEEYVAGNIDIAFALISEAYVLGDGTKAEDKIYEWLEGAVKGDLDTAICRLQRTDNYPDEKKEWTDILLNKYNEKQKNL